MGSLNQSPPKPLVLIFALSVITVIVCIRLYLKLQTSTQFTNACYKDISCGLYSRNSNTNQSNSFHISKVENTSAQEKKIIIAFQYWEQLSRATQSLLDLAALATYGGRQVVVPFVRNSNFYGEWHSSTLELYFNVTALNRTLVSHGYGALTNWKDFQNVCKGRLDVLVYFDYTDVKKIKTYSLDKPYIPCKNSHSFTFKGIKIDTATCVNVSALDSAERFEVEVAKRLPCVGIHEWRGSDKKVSYRAQFDFNSAISNVLYLRDTNTFFNSELLRIAKDFMSENLGPFFMSVHIRSERLLMTKGNNISMVNKCLSTLIARVQKISNANTMPLVPVFMATDFTEFGSGSRDVKPARENVQLLKETLGPLKAITFQPSKYKLNDRGAVAIVEMNILASGKHLVVLGGGFFQWWVQSQFLDKNGEDYSKIVTLAC